MSNITCQDARPWLDSIADGNTYSVPDGMADHSRRCVHCSAELARIQTLKRDLRKAVMVQPLPLGLETRIRASIGASDRSPSWWKQPVWQAVTASFALAALTAGLWLSVYRPLRAELVSILHLGQHDHVHCTLERKKPPFGQLQRPLPGRHAEIVPVAQRAMPAGFRMVESHYCRVQGRVFTHLVFTNGSQRLSVIVTGKKSGERLPLPALLSRMRADGIPVYQDRIEGLQTAAIETQKSLGYVVSDLPAAENLRIMAALAGTITSVDQ